jgi:riboflavin biosynthesis pyrimidine reductase
MEILMKPHIICHMMGPLDGELVVDKWSASSGRSSQELIDVYEGIHGELKADAWISGRSVGEEFATGKPHPPSDIGEVVRPIHVTRNGAKEYAVLIDLHGKLHWTSDEIAGGAIVVILGPDVPDAHLAELRDDGISYIVIGERKLNATVLLQTLSEKFGIRNLLLEGGAATNGGFFAEQLVDEISLVLFPAIGGHEGARTLFAAGETGLAEKVILKTLSGEPRELGTFHLRYAVGYS